MSNAFGSLLVWAALSLLLVSIFFFLLVEVKNLKTLSVLPRSKANWRTSVSLCAIVWLSPWIIPPSISKHVYVLVTQENVGFQLQVRATGALVNVVIASYLIGENILALVKLTVPSFLNAITMTKTKIFGSCVESWFVDNNKCSCPCHLPPLLHRHHCSSIHESHILHFWVSGMCVFITFSLKSCQISCMIWLPFSHLLNLLTAFAELRFLRVLAASFVCYILHKAWIEGFASTAKMAGGCHMIVFLQKTFLQLICRKHWL